MAKPITIKGYIVHETWKGETHSKYRFQEYPALKNNENYVQIPVCEHALTFDMPDGFDPRPEQIKMLEALKQKVRADFAARITEIDSQIQSLLAIENTVEAS